MQILLLAGGSSSRFQPLGDKNLYTFLGKSLVQIQLEKLLQFFEMSEIVIVANDQNYKVIQKKVNEFQSIYRSKSQLSLKTHSQTQQNLKSKNLQKTKRKKESINKEDESIQSNINEKSVNKIKVVRQLGQGQSGAVLTGINSFSNNQDLLILNMNDIFDDEIYQKFLQRKEIYQKNQINVIAAKKLEKYFPGGYLVLQGKKIKEVIEKPGKGNEPSKYLKLVFDYYYDSEILKRALKKAQSNKDDVFEIAISNLMKSKEKFEMMEYKSDWYSIKYPWHVLDMSKYFLSKFQGQRIDPSAQIHESAIIEGDVYIGANVKIFANAYIKGPVFIGDNSIIGNNALVRESMIGKESVIGFGSEVARSYFLEQVWLHMNYVGDSIVGKNVSFGSTAVTANFRLDERNICVKIKGEEVNTGVQKLGAIIGCDVRIGVGAKLMPGVRIGTNSVIGPGVVLKNDIADNQFVQLQNIQKISENKYNIKNLDRDKIKKIIK